jgi:hypothetical protein
MKTGKYWRKIIFSLAITTLVVSGFVFQGMDGTARADQKKSIMSRLTKYIQKTALIVMTQLQIRKNPVRPGMNGILW